MKNKFSLENLSIIMQKFAGQRHLLAIRDGIVINIIPSIIGSIFLLLVAVPIPGWGEFLANSGWDKILLLPVSSTLDLMGIIAVITIAYRLSESYSVDPLIGAVVSLLCFFQLTPYQFKGVDMASPIFNVIPVMWFGSKGLFTAILVSITSIEIYRRVMQSNLKITLPESVPPAVLKSFLAIIPATITLMCFWIMRVIIDFSPFENIHTVLGQFVSSPLTRITGTIWGALGIVFFIQFFWFFGIHGGSIIYSVIEPLLFLLQDQNRLAFQAGEPLPNILTRWWFDIYVFLGGSGATLAAVVPLLFYARSQHLKKVSGLAIIPTIFSINEPFTFGLPIVFNPLVFIPWICAPLVNVLIAYNATLIGFLPRHNGITIPWTTPMIISGFLVGGWRGAAMQVINFVVSASIWYFFIKKIDQIEYQRELDSLQKNLSNSNH